MDTATYESVIAPQTCEELLIEIPTGYKLAAKAWGPVESDIRVLAVHGWLDNANTFDLLAPFLAASGIRVVCIDLIGHGRSPMKPLWCQYSFVDYLNNILDAVESLGWKSFSYMGHSMGAGVGCLLGATMPDLVERIVFIDMLGPMSTNTDAVTVMTTALQERNKIISRQPLLYPNRQLAMQRYRRNNPFISERGAELLLKRGLNTVVSADGKTGVKFVHDPRLVGNSPVRMRESDALGFLSKIKCPVLLIYATSSVLQYKSMQTPESKEKFKARLEAVQEIEVLEVDGSHHVHLDAPELFAEKVLGFFLAPSVANNPDVVKVPKLQSEQVRRLAKL